MTYTPRPWDQRLLCPSCHKVRMNLWVLPFDSVWHCNGCGNTIVADQKVLDWSALVGTTIRCRWGARNTTMFEGDSIRMVKVVSVRGNEVEIKMELNAGTDWYTIYDGYLGSGEYYSGWHIAKVV